MKMWGWLYYSDETETNPDKYWRDYAQRMYDRASYETNPAARSAAWSNRSRFRPKPCSEKIARIYDYIQNEIHNTGLRQERGGGTRTRREAEAE